VIVGLGAETACRRARRPGVVLLSRLGVPEWLASFVGRSEAEHRAVGVHVDHSAPVCLGVATSFQLLLQHSGQCGLETLEILLDEESMESYRQHRSPVECCYRQGREQPLHWPSSGVQVIIIVPGPSGDLLATEHDDGDLRVWAQLPINRTRACVRSLCSPPGSVTGSRNGRQRRDGSFVGRGFRSAVGGPLTGHRARFTR
jgi:hypothetical protein